MAEISFDIKTINVVPQKGFEPLLIQLRYYALEERCDTGAFSELGGTQTLKLLIRVQRQYSIVLRARLPHFGSGQPENNYC
jgi:hypothetical protein